MRPRILIAATQPDPSGEPAICTLDTRQSHHLVRVLRLTAGAPVECFDGAGARFDARIERADPKACTLRLLGPIAACAESPLAITLVQCISAAERMDWTIEKAVELGAHAIQPVISARTQARLDAQRLARRHAHWARIVEAACMQCGRDRMPELWLPVGFGHWLGAVDRGAARTRIVLDPRGTARLGALRPDPARPLDLLVGPEGGFDAAELEAARAAGFLGVRLGPRVLRTETAGLAAIAALQAIAGDF
ncbi:MAG: 16S rRNA (uracil(1498)-N(3))-methyltransferase [Lautropia sp.]|nr:MAG: 16S rRNA (uracil(1498)-N(3))-methyltransferase [Pseudomonadota bacterium]MBC6959506.1 16S rRNA (uracil(1498)-N(3))-methyltransferase [Lautropia sp.]MCL4702609.1 16S rRNA (uracil(1498)-N(3))-methyltransferase [Burkholderiaceae bacterium]MDL1906676.1 16S rRNA (uracil(1498)-N(3))-methyltransferase [Betaproteobacteria bacterium PRO1]RIK90885.1 MAG: 16S rRNA (uracil(1498)-N(3))-methyltransferase [Burkholderiales bacterium]